MYVLQQATQKYVFDRYETLLDISHNSNIDYDIIIWPAGLKNNIDILHCILNHRSFKDTACLVVASLWMHPQTYKMLVEQYNITFMDDNIMFIMRNSKSSDLTIWVMERSMNKTNIHKFFSWCVITKKYYVARTLVEPYADLITFDDAYNKELITIITM